jgi:hypothetical protein
MTESAEPQGVRIGSAEREAAIAALGDHMNAGRLEPDEYGDRVAKVSVARYADDLTPLFVDLPSSPSSLAPAYGAKPAPQQAASPVPASAAAVADPSGPRFGQVGTVLVAASPFIALILFFGLDSAGAANAWLAFLLVPLVGALVYGGGSGAKSGRDRDRDRRRNRR